jgi:DNA excision repair protein ERCC-5
MALSAISNRTTSKNLRPLTTKKIDRKSKSTIPLFDLDDDDELLAEQPIFDYSEVDDHDLVAYAVQESFDQSNFTKNVASTSQDNPTSSAIRPVSPSRDSSPEDDFYMDYPAPTRLETALSIANADGSSRAQLSPSKSVSGSSILFGKPTLLISPSKQPQMPAASLSSSDDEITMVATSRVRNDQTFLPQKPEIRGDVTPEQPASSSVMPISIDDSDDDGDMEEVTPEEPASSSIVPMSIEESDDDDMEEVPVPFTPHNIMHDSPPPVASPLPDGPPSPSLPLVPPIEEVQDILPFQGPVTVPLDADLNNDPLFIISRTPSPSHEAQDLRPPSPPIAEDWDAAEEMDVQAEEGEFARFISQVKGKDLSSVRKEIDDEIKALNEQKKAAMRDSEDITQQMVSQIMVREYGLDFTSDSMQTHLYYIILFLRRCYVFSVYHT